jgi:transcriptional regulator of acetoin/glycerol metabolism
MGDDQFVRHTDLGLRSEKSELNAVRSVKRIPETACSSRKTCSSDELIEALKRHSYNITNVAGELSLSRVTIYRMMKRYGLERQLNS